MGASLRSNDKVLLEGLHWKGGPGPSQGDGIAARGAGDVAANRQPPALPCPALRELLLAGRL